MRVSLLIKDNKLKQCTLYWKASAADEGDCLLIRRNEKTPPKTGGFSSDLLISAEGMAYINNRVTKDLMQSQSTNVPMIRPNRG